MTNLFNVNQAAFILKVHPLTIRRYIREGKLKAVKVGGNVRIDEKDLQDFNKDFTPRENPNKEPGIRQKYNPPKTFSDEDPFLRLQGRGATVKLSS
jgi:excisionase family DNA binding protein